MTDSNPFAETIEGDSASGSEANKPAGKRNSALVVGEMIQEVFKVERFIASGGMGQVFQARDLRLERPVAVKVLHGNFQESRDGLRRFQREARSLSRVVHPNVVATYEVGMHENSPFLVMEFVDGPTLGQHIRSSGKLSVEEAFRLTMQIAAGLEEAHALGIVHRDVKPGNILLHRLRSGGLVAKVVDFGLALAVEGGEADLGATQSGRHELVGSPLYMSPEQIKGGELTGASDQYSLAIVLYEMLSGRPPFVGDSLNAIFNLHLTGEVPDLAVNLPESESTQLNEALAKAMSKDPLERFASVSEFLTAIRSATGHDDGGSGESTACDVCGSRVYPDDGFCRGCGTPVPMKECQVCGAPRVGKRFHCIQCSASLLVRPGSRTAVIDPAETGRVGVESLTTLGVVVTLEAVSDDLMVPEWSWMVEEFRMSVEREHGHMLAVMGSEAFAIFGMGGIRELEVERAIDASLYVMDLVNRKLEEDPAMEGVRVHIAVEQGAIDAEDAGLAWGTARMTGPGIQAVRKITRQAERSGVFIGTNAWREVRSLYESATEGGVRRLLNRRRVAILREASSIGGEQVPLVGRAYEIEHLERAFARMVKTRRLVVVPVIGMPGIGKSRLISEFLGALNQRSENCQVDVSQCIPSSDNVPFSPFRRSFRNRHPTFGGDDPQTVQSLLRHLPGIRDLSNEVAAQRVEHLSMLLGVGRGAGSQDEAVMSPSDPSQDLAFEAYCDYVRGMARETPHVLVLDDVQWIRPSSAKLLGYLATHCEDSPILVMLTVRQKDASKILGGLNLNISSVSSLELGVLTARDVETLATRVFGEEVLNPKLLATLYELSNGLPQELEGHLEALVDSGSLRKEEGRWVYDPVTDTGSALPQSLRELVHQRLVRLGPEEQRILRAGALAGQSFSLELLSAMIDRAIDNRELDALVAEGWLMESDAGDFPRAREVSFRQDRVREVILEMLNEEVSESLHRKAAEWLGQDDHPVQSSARTARLARHHCAAGNHREGAQFTLEKARELSAAFAGTEALGAYVEVMELAQPLLAEARPGDIALFVEAGLGRAYHGWVLGHHEEARETLEALSTYVTPGRKPMEWYRQQYLRGELAMAREELAEAIACLSEASEMARENGHLGQAAQLMGRLLFAKASSGDVEAAVSLANDVLAMETASLRMDRLWNIGAGSAMGLLARVALKGKDFQKARGHYRSAMEFRRGASDPVGMWMAKMGEGTVFFFEEKWTDAELVYDQVSRELHGLGYRSGAAQASVNLAEVKLMLGKPQDALDLLEEPEVTLRSVKSFSNLVELWRCRCEALLQLGRRDDARTQLEAAVALAEENGLTRALGSLQALGEKLSAP